MRGINVVSLYLCSFCLLHTAIGQSFDVRVNLAEGKNAGHQVHSFPTPASNQMYTFFPAQDADSKAALTLFQISEQGVVTTTKPIDFETGEKNYYDLVAIRRNRGDKEGGTPLSIRISITDTNNFSPTFPANFYHGRVTEDSPANTIVMGLENCFAEDRDTVGSITYSISGGNENGYFKAEQAAAGNRVFLVLKTTSTFSNLKRDVTPEVNLTVRASDGLRYGTTRVTVKILDANNNIPVFDETSYTATIGEDTPLLTSVLRVRATDKDEGTNGGVYYYLKSLSPWFSVDAITGVVKVVGQLPNQALVSLEVMARDRGTPSKEKQVTVNINIELIANYPLPDSPNPGVNTLPIFPEESYSANVREDFPVGAALLIIHAVDRDPPGPNRRLRYSLSGDNAFTIGATSGVVTLRNQLNFAIKNKYDLNVVATDRGSSPQSATATLTILVQEVDKNRHAPVFQSASANKQQLAASVIENRLANTKVGNSISATDADGSQRPEGQVVFSIASGSGLPYFKIDKNSGDVRTVTVLDTEKQAQYNLLIEARDKALYPLYSHLYMMITVTGEDDNNPDFSQPVYYANVPGKAPANTFVTQIHATDKDGDTVSYSIENPGNAFVIQSDSGVISTRRELDPANEERSFALSVRATSRAKESQAQVIVTVISEENSPPTFVNLPYSATVPENLGRIESLLCLAAKDSQGKTVTYGLVSNTDGKFSVDEESGRFTATGSLDYESYTGGVYQVKASSGPLQVATEKVTIKVTDTRDPPRFSRSKYIFQINEDIAPGTTVTKTNSDGSSGGLVINDADTPKTQFDCTIENIQSLDVVNQFKVELDSSNNIGECKLVTQSSFDHFDTPKFTFEVRATDVNYRNMYASAEVEIEIVDKNNHDPTFSQTDYWTSVSSNFPVRNSILKITATDKDAGSFGEITYQLLDFEDRNRFSIDSSTGVLTSANSLATKKYQLKVQASDRAQNNNDVRRSTVTVYVSVYPPGTTVIQFNAASYSKILPENSPTNTPVFTVSAKGPSSIRYKIVGGNTNNAFKISPSTGLVSVAGSIDRESKSSYQLVVRAETTNLAKEVTTVINIGDANDNNPRITFMKEPKNIAIEDYSPKGSFVIKVTAIDRDVGDNGVVKYSIPTQSTPFQIDQNTGVITASREIRRSEKQSWDINVRATDGKGLQSPLFAIKIFVTAGVQPPQLQATYSVSLDENKAVGFPVKDISPSLNNPNYKYSIIGGNIDDAFCINHAGVISVAKPLDREKKDSYKLKVSVSVGTKVTNTSVDVTIRDKNDDAPKFTKPVYSFDVSENKGINQEVGKVSATDLDSGRNGEVQYELLYVVEANSKFQLDLTTGSISTLAKLDYEQIREHVLYIGASDKGVPSLSTIAKVVLNVRDVNDQSPKFSADSYVAKVALDVKVDSQVLLVIATDLDNGDNGKVVYNITGGNDEGAFKIDPDTGVLKVRKSLTTVSASQFTLEVEAKDKGNPPLRKTATVQLNVFLPDGPPRFVVKPVIQEVTEGVKANDRVMVVKAATSEALTYEITSGNEGGLFRMVPSTGEIRVTRELDYEEAREHQLVVRVMDSRDRSDQVTVVIKVKNINDNPPQFPGDVDGVVERKVEDDFRVGDNVARLSAGDKDGDTISYTLSSNVQSLFSIDSEGFLIAKKPRSDFKSPVKFQLTAKDSGSPPRETKVEVQLVLVNYRGDQQPVRVYVREDKSVGSVIAIVPRYFPGGTLSIIYPRKSNFTVDNSGKVRMEAPFDYEEQQFYGLTIRETEPAPRSRTNDVDVEINVVDINDNKPVMKMIDFFGRVNTNSRPGVKAYQLKSEDKDSGLAGRIGYQMVSRKVPFGINPLTEVVETAGNLEERGGYNVTLYGFDFGVPRQFGESVYLDIKTVNFKPVFSENPYKFTVFEKELPGNPVGKVNATSVSGARLGFAISQGDPDSKFAIDNTGQIRVNSLLDREKQAIYNLKVRATEQIPRGYSNDVDVEIILTNANEHVPYFPNPEYVKSISESAGAGAKVLSVVAYDCDCQGCGCDLGDLTYSLVGTSLFKIDKVTGDISVGDSALDYEAQREHTFTVIVKDFGEKRFESRAFVRVIVQNDNDEVPSFQESEYNIGIAEDAAINTPLAAIVARDADGAIPRYSITSGDGGNIFNINPSTGVLSLRQSVRGKQTQYSLQVRATDTKNSKFDEVRVIVNIEDINDNRPVFTVCPTTVDIAENEPRGEVVTQVTAVDKDRGRNKEIEYSVTGGNKLFEIDNSTGVITAITSLDREGITEGYTLIVQAEDGGHGRNEAERLLSYCVIEVKVLDKNDNYPVFNEKRYLASVFHKAPIGTTVVTVSASDADEGSNQKVAYSLVGANDKFDVNRDTGDILTNADLSNFEQTVVLTVRATNTEPIVSNLESPRDSETTVEINVVDQRPPIFQPSNIYSKSIPENTKLGYFVVVINAVSKVNAANKITYSLVKSNPDAEQKFQVNPDTGNVTTAGMINYEQQKSFKLQFRARESATNLYATCTVLVTMIDVNDDAPTFKLSEYTARVPENANPPFNVITIKADDRDTNQFGQVTYALDSLTNDFRIVANNGTIFSRQKFDREARERYIMTASASDQTFDTKVTVNVDIVDQNDMPPVFAQRRYEATVQEDAVIGTSIRELSATDGDIGENAKLDYFISSGDQSQKFKMETVYQPQRNSAKNYGILILDGKLDYESIDTYTIKVTATDRKDSDTVDVVIKVIDTNDNVPKFSALIYEKTILENSEPGKSVVKVAATDLDSSKVQSELRYSIDKTGQTYFTIDAKTGLITTANNRLDREKQQIVSFFVYASDGKHTGEAFVRVNLTDRNDNAPYFPSPPYIGYVEENKDPGTSVMVLQAIDLDSGINAEIVYELEDDANDKFRIDPDSGLVTTLETLEKENAENEFTIVVKATNRRAGGDPLKSGTVSATIRVTDGNDQKPVFDPTIYRANVPEDALPGFFVTKVKASDADEGPNAELEYTIESGNDPYEFYIDPRTGDILVSGLLDFDKGKKSYNLTIKVTDRGNPPQEAEEKAFVYINVLDANDNPPVFVPAVYNKVVSESVDPGASVAQVTAIDKDTGTNAEFTFSITDGDDANMFAITSDPNNGSIGIISTLLQIDRETIPKYNLTITATDSGGLQGVGLVYITVKDFNDNGPWFIPRYYEGTIRAGINPPAGQPVTEIKAYDPDEASNGAPFAFVIVDTDLRNRFRLTSPTATSTSMFAFGPFDREVTPEWEVEVKATDSGSPSKSNTTSVYVDVVSDDNLHEPEDGALTIIVNAYNGKFAGGIIGRAYYKDDDFEVHGNQFTMVSSPEYFSVNSGNGNITAEANVPLGTYKFSVQVTDAAFSKTVTSDVTVIVQSVTTAALQQSVAVQIFELRKTSVFVGDYYSSWRSVFADILTDGDEDHILIFSVQKAPVQRVPLLYKFGVEIYFAVRDGSGYMNHMEIVKKLGENKEDLELEDRTIGSIGIDACAYEQQQVGKCSNEVQASSAFTVVSGDYGQFPAPGSSLTLVSMNVVLRGVYTTIIPEEKNCSTGTHCLHGGTCHNAVPKGIICECGRDFRGPECQSTTRTFKGNSFIHLEKLIAYQRSTVSMQFLTGTANGLLLYQGPLYEGANNGLPDVMALMLVDGFVKLVLTLGPHPNAPLELYMNRGDRLDDRQWHTVEVIRSLKKVTLRIDKCSHSQIVEDNGEVIENRASCEIEGEVWGSAIYLNGFGPLQIGGVENTLNDANINFKGFEGCIRDIYDNDKMYDLLNPLLQKNTELGCKLDNNPCPDCNDHGYCEPLWTNSICVCDLGYTGPNCNSRTNANWYKPNSFTQYQVRQSKRKRRELVPPPVSMANEFYTNIALQVRVSPNSSNVVIFLASNSLGTEFNRIDVKNHVLRYIFRLGDRMKILSIPQLNVTDDKYHTVIVKREGNRASLQIDYSGKVEGTTGGLHKLLNMGGGSFFTGGLPNVTEVRVVEAFVNSGGNAILRTPDGNIISSGIGAGLMGYGSSSAGVMGTNIVVGSGGQVSTYSSFLGMELLRMRGVAAGGVSSAGGRVFVGRSEKYVNVRVIQKSIQTSGTYVVISSTGGGTAVGSGVGASGGAGGGGAAGGAGVGGAAGGDGVGGAAGGGAGGVGVGTGSGIGVGSSGGASGSGGGSTVLGSASSLSAYGELSAYGSGISSWTIGGATTDGTGEIEVIGDFGGCTASNNYNGVDLDNDASIEARRQNVEFGCPCSANLCLHGGTCVNAVPPYCLCPPGWSGPRCENIVTTPNTGARANRWVNPAVIACVLVIILAILAIIGAVLLKRRPQPTVVAVVEDGHVHDNVRPYHDEGAGEEDNFSYDITTLMKYTYVENGVAGAGGAGYGKFKDGGAGGVGEEEFTVAENKPLLTGAMPGVGLQHGVTTITKRRVVHPESIDVKQFIDTRVLEADGEYVLSIDELHIYRYEGDDSDVDDLSELGDSDEEPDEEEEQEFAFLQEWGRKFDNLNRIFNEED